ncbi:MAG: O-succinylbenzoic acid--CoA ligase [Alphaproteobacteria bacterium HGW-Alphaproteobacteria-5]|nr:MAG: O-succinylbenzoic acid--CoA ligase [Alphaproteobacteria bacterium HGW-Alphaproteobacteria-5]
MRRERGSDDQVLARHPERPAGIAAMLAAAALADPDGEALIDGETRLCWCDLETEVAKLAGGLQQEGIRPGDRVALLIGNRHEFLLLAYAAAWLGCAFVPISEREAEAGVARLIEDSGARAIFFEPSTVAEVPGNAAAFAVCVDIESAAFAGLRASAPIGPHEGDEDDLAAIVYTSGTTGVPKGAMLSQGGIVHSAMNYARTMVLSGSDRSLAAVPLTHVTGLVAIAATALFAGAATVIMRRFDARECLETMARERITHTVLVPAMYNLCLLRADFRSLDLVAWRIGGYGGAPMADATIRNLFAVLPGLQLMNLYGATETTSPAVIMPPAHALAHSDAVGIPAPGVEIVAMDEAGREVAPGEPGELWIRGAGVVRGYWRNAGATAREFVSGFWKSGDLGSIDADGFVHVHDRNKDMINRGGYKVYSAEIEALLAEVQGVVESAVVARPCAVLGERVHAVVVFAEGSAPDPAALAAHVGGRLADYKVPETWDIRSEPLPRNANGKVLKRALRDAIGAYVPTAAGG